MRAMMLACLLPACAVHVRGIPTPIYNTTGVDDRRVIQVVNAFVEKMPLRLEEVTVVVDDDARMQYCEGLADACTFHIKERARRQSIVHVPWDRRYRPEQLLAHELCHVYYFQMTGQGDAGHEHTECYSDVAGRM